MKQQIDDENMFNQNKNSFYDMIIKINSFKELEEKGWEIINNSKNRGKTNSEEKCTVVSVIGDKNTGKSFLLGLIAKKNIPNGYSVTTEGISICIPYTEDNNGNYILIDTAGTDSPLLVDERGLSKEQIDEKVKDRQITDYFLQKFLYTKSNIFICVVDFLTLTSQKFINRIIKNTKTKYVYLIHNLKTFTEKEQVENYINTKLKKSMTFELDDNYFITEYFSSIEEKQKDNFLKKNQKYFKQKLLDQRVVIHLLLANKESKAGEYYNHTTIAYLKTQLEQVLIKEKIDMIENLKQFLISISGEILEEQLDTDSITVENNFIKWAKGKEKKIKLKDCQTDIWGNNIIPNKIFKPNYRCGYCSSNNIFVIEIELGGNWNICSDVDYQDTFFQITVSGELVMNQKNTFKEKIIDKDMRKVIEKNEEKEEKKNKSDKGESIDKNMNEIQILKNQESIKKNKKEVIKKYNNYPGKKFEIIIKVENERGVVNKKPKYEVFNGLHILTYSLRCNKTENEVVKVGEEEEDDDDYYPED